MPLPTLVLGDFNLTDGLGVQFHGAMVMAQGTSRGNPVPLEVAVKSWLQDGNIVATQGYDNREVSVRVRLGGSDLTAAAELEAALVAELNKPNTLTWTPANGPASVFRVVTSSLDQDDTYESADIIEANHNLRFYMLRLVCEPFVRSEAETVTAALATGGTTTTNVDTCGSATGWTGSGTVTNTVGPPTTNSVTQSAAYGEFLISLRRTGSVTTSSLKYLVVDHRVSPASLPSLYTRGPLVVLGDGVALPRVAEVVSPTAGYTRSTFYVAASSLTTIDFEWISNQPSGTGFPAAARSLAIDNIAVSDARPVIGSAHQQLRSLAVTGSARTQGSLAIESATAALGDTIVYVYPDDPNAPGYVPALRSYRTAGNTVTTNSSLCSGASESITGSGVTYQVPVANLPTSAYTLTARFLTAGTTIDWRVSTSLGGVDKGVQTGTFTVPSTASSYRNFTMARILLPTTDLDGASPAVVSINIASSSTCNIDEAWIFGNFGALTVVNCGTGTAAVGGPAKRLFLEPATVQTPRPTVRIGHSADRSDAYHPGSALIAWQVPVFEPETVNVFTCTAAATDTTVALRHYASWHSHAAS